MQSVAAAGITYLGCRLCRILPVGEWSPATFSPDRNFRFDAPACSGENIEPQPIEDAVCVSPLIKFCTVVGNDCKHLGALVVPDHDAIAERFAGVLCRATGGPTLGPPADATEAAARKLAFDSHRAVFLLSQRLAMIAQRG